MVWHNARGWSGWRRMTEEFKRSGREGVSLEEFEQIVSGKDCVIENYTEEEEGLSTYRISL